MASKNATTITIINTLAKAARPISDDDWASERQIAAENAFFDYVRGYITAGPRAKAGNAAWDTFQAWALKATTNEMIDEALRGLLGMHRHPGETLWR